MYNSRLLCLKNSKKKLNVSIDWKMYKRIMYRKQYKYYTLYVYT